MSAAKHLPALDGLRGIAILAVLVTHSAPRLADSYRGHLFNQFTEAGSFGVDLFFVLSGFLITGILMDTKGSPRYFQNFYVRRFLRLFPVYYVYLAAIALLLPGLHRIARSSMDDYSGNWLWYLLYVCNLKSNRGVTDPYLGHFWSLAVEEQFYLLWPAVVGFVSRRMLAYCCIMAIVAGIAMRILGTGSGADWNTVYRLTPMRFDALAWGAMASIAWRQRDWARRLKAVAPLVIFVGGVIFILAAYFAGTTSWKSPSIQTWGSAAIEVAFAATVFLAAQGDSAMARILSAAWLRRFGRYSYTIYVVHVVAARHVVYLAAALKGGGATPIWVQWLTAGLIVLLSYGAAAISWKYFETPILALKVRFGGPSAS